MGICDSGVEINKEYNKSALEIHNKKRALHGCDNLELDD